MYVVYVQVFNKVVQDGINTEVVSRHMEQLSALLPDSWAQLTEQASITQHGKLGGDLTTARSSTSKPRIREAYTNMGSFCQLRGDLSGALKHFSLARDHSSNAIEVHLFLLL